MPGSANHLIFPSVWPTWRAFKTRKLSWGWKLYTFYPKNGWSSRAMEDVEHRRDLTSSMCFRGLRKLNKHWDAFYIVECFFSNHAISSRTPLWQREAHVPSLFSYYLLFFVLGIGDRQSWAFIYEDGTHYTLLFTPSGTIPAFANFNCWHFPASVGM